MMHWTVYASCIAAAGLGYIIAHFWWEWYDRDKLP
jgi:hypothetical protein